VTGKVLDIRIQGHSLPPREITRLLAAPGEHADQLVAQRAEPKPRNVETTEGGATYHCPQLTHLHSPEAVRTHFPEPRIPQNS